MQNLMPTLILRPYNSEPSNPFTPGATADATKELELNQKPFGYFKLPVHVFDPDADSFISVNIFILFHLVAVNDDSTTRFQETQQLQPAAENHEETMQQSEKVTSEAQMNETLHDLQRVNGGTGNIFLFPSFPNSSGPTTFCVFYS